MTGLREAMAIDGTCTMERFALQFLTTCGLKFPVGAVMLSDMGAIDGTGIARLAEAHRIHHDEGHPVFSQRGHLDVMNHHDPLDGDWITVTCHH